MNVRVYRDGDLEAVCALWREVFPDAPAHNDPARDIAIKRGVQPERAQHQQVGFKSLRVSARHLS